MTPFRWHQVTALFQAALLHDASERRDFLAAACRDDDELRKEVEALLVSHEASGNFIEEQAMNIVGKDRSQGTSMAGETVGHYRVQSLIGSGGMGDVYLALDTRLGRHVALKLLPEYLAGDRHRAQLFTREARAASALNHPNIITIYEIGQLKNRYYISMEYIEGETLREKIHHEKLSLEKLVSILRQVAEGLSKAHAAGIVHRDLKPDNIMVTRDGYAKILDFGLAKLMVGPGTRETDKTNSSETATALMMPQSLPGVVMGTAGYMSPEQAQGLTNNIDHRTDIFSFGCILYEAATGQSAFAGKDVIDSLHKVIHAPVPAIKDTLPNAPEDLDRIVRRCLAKDPERRYQSIKEVAIELEDLQQKLLAQSNDHVTRAGGRHTVVSNSMHATTAPISSAEYLVREVKQHKAAAIAIATVLVSLFAISFVLLYRYSTGHQRQNVSAPFQRMNLTRLTTTGKTVDAAISPDGKYIACLNVEYGQRTGSIWIRQVATGNTVQLVESGPRFLRGLSFSPDSNYLYYRILDEPRFFATLYRTPVFPGGEPRKVISGVFSPISFSPDGKRVAFVRNHRPVVGNTYLMVANSDGSDERVVTTHKDQAFAYPIRPTAPVWSADGTFLACALFNFVSSSTSLLEVRVDTGVENPIGTQHWAYIDRLEWLPGGGALLLTARDESSPQAQVWQVDYPSGAAQRITNDLNDYQGLSLTADGKSMVAVQTIRESELWLMPNGKPSEARAITPGAGKADGYWGMSWTPEGKVVYASNASGNRDIWLADLSSGKQKQLTSASGQNFYPIVTHDGKAILFVSDRNGSPGIWRMDIDGNNPRRVGDKTINPAAGGISETPDGQSLIFSLLGDESIPTVFKMGMDNGNLVQLTSHYWAELASASPDGKRIACQFFEIGQPSAIGWLSIGGGQITEVTKPDKRLQGLLKWTPDGNEIAYENDPNGVSNIWSVPVSGGKSKQITDFKSGGVFWFDWSRDGKQLAVSHGTQISDVVLINNFR